MVTYLYEQLSADKFQQLCQALIASEYPHAQCLPVSQADGGRDAFLIKRVKQRSSSIVIYQVKFTSQTQAERNPERWLDDILREERESIDRLIRAGAKQYIVVTNLRGTAREGSGSIDKAQKILDEKVPIASQCYWRDDIDRRLESRPAIVWSYPEIMRGTDVLAALVTQRVSEDRDRRSAAVKSYLAGQYRADQEVKFKQIDLQNRLIELFIDVPIGPTNDISTRRLAKIQDDEHGRVSFSYSDAYEDFFTASTQPEFGRFYPQQSDTRQGAANFLLSSFAQSHVQRIVLEGAPGQGKSTICQYVCQVHRMRLLGKDDVLARIPPGHQNASVRLPLKVDLRELGAWLEGKNPFYPIETTPPPLEGWSPSLESFLAAQIRHESGGASFNVSDLQAVFRECHVLIALDGFDEVADINLRKKIIEATLASAERLENFAHSLQIIITSRPAAFANSPGFPDDIFFHLSLRPVSNSQALEYANKWSQARDLSESEKGDFLKIFEEKIEEVHISELARNPMQLAILLTLIRSRGYSLPDKRTAIYTSYMDLFFDRETEKSDVVRQHRDLLLNMHSYIAWLLHCEAESKGGRGVIGRSRLRAVMLAYLDRQGHPVTLVDDILTGMEQRIVAIVARVEGQYEFEVQPVREYFAARHLYKTAPYSPSGPDATGGTKPERFNALCKNFYWTNVIRFYAGFYDQGELASLIERIEDIIEEEHYGHVAHTRLIGIFLLSDWVFSQQPRIADRVVRIITEREGLRLLAAVEYNSSFGIVNVKLPEGSGRLTFMRQCIREMVKYIRENSQQDYIASLARYVLDNVKGHAELGILWTELVNESGPEATEASLAVGAALRVFDENEELFVCHKNLVTSSDENFRLALRGGADIWVEDDEALHARAVSLFLNDHEYWTPPTSTQAGLLSYVRWLLDPRLYRDAVRYRYGEPKPIIEYLKSVMPNLVDKIGEIHNARSITKTHSTTVERCRKFLLTIEQLTIHTDHEWAINVEIWNSLIEKTRDDNLDGWAVLCCANAVPAILYDNPNVHVSDIRLADATKPLVTRIMVAKSKARSTSWWSRTLEASCDETSAMITIAVMLSWAAPSVIMKLRSDIEQRLEGISATAWFQLFKAVQLATTTRRFAPLGFKAGWFSRNSNHRFALIGALRASNADAEGIYENVFREYNGYDPTVWSFCLKNIFSDLASGKTPWSEVFKACRQAYARGGLQIHSSLELHPNYYPRSLSTEHARKICEDSPRYPLALLALAQSRYTADLGRRSRSVAEVAERSSWADCEDFSRGTVS